MITYEPVQYLFKIGNFKVEPEPVAMIFAFIVFMIYIYFSLKKEKSENINAKEFLKLILIIIFSALAGGRIWYYAGNWQGILALFDLRIEGLISIGMIIGGMVGLLIYISFFMKKDKKFNWQISFARISDIIAPAAALFIFIFRQFGCFLWGCVVGVTTTVPWGLYWEATDVIRHPTALYLSLSALFIFLILRSFFGHEKTKKTRFGKRFDGEVGLWFLLLYCFNRFFIEFLRVGYYKYYGLNTVQWVCLGGIIILSVWLTAGYIILSKE